MDRDKNGMESVSLEHRERERENMQTCLNIFWGQFIKIVRFENVKTVIHFANLVSFFEGVMQNHGNAEEGFESSTQTLLAY